MLLDIEATLGFTCLGAKLTIEKFALHQQSNTFATQARGHFHYEFPT